MITLHRLNGDEMTLNAELILTVEATPDTHILMMDRRQLLVTETRRGGRRRPSSSTGASSPAGATSPRPTTWPPSGPVADAHVSTDRPGRRLGLHHRRDDHEGRHDRGDHQPAGLHHGHGRHRLRPDRLLRHEGDDVDDQADDRCRSRSARTTGRSSSGPWSASARRPAARACSCSRRTPSRPTTRSSARACAWSWTAPTPSWSRTSSRPSSTRWRSATTRTRTCSSRAARSRRPSASWPPCSRSSSVLQHLDEPDTLGPAHLGRVPRHLLRRGRREHRLPADRQRPQEDDRPGGQRAPARSSRASSPSRAATTRASWPRSCGASCRPAARETEGEDEGAEPRRPAPPSPIARGRLGRPWPSASSDTRSTRTSAGSSPTPTC